MIRIVIADDQDLIRSGLRAILEVEPDLEVVAEASDGGTAVEQAVEQAADVVLMDVEMPHCNGIEGVHRLMAARPRTKALMLTTFDLDEYVYEALRAGASGFLLKTASPGDLATAVRAVHGGEMLFSPAVTRRLVESYVRRPPATASSTPRVGAADRPGARRLPRNCPRVVERRDRRRALSGRGDCPDPCQPHSGQARPSRQSASSRSGTRVRSHMTCPTRRVCPSCRSRTRRSTRPPQQRSPIDVWGPDAPASPWPEFRPRHSSLLRSLVTTGRGAVSSAADDGAVDP